MSPESRTGSDSRLWMIVELILIAGITTVVILINLRHGAVTLPQTVGYVFIALGILSFLGIEIYLAVRSPRQM